MTCNLKVAKSVTENNEQYQLEILFGERNFYIPSYS